MSIKPSGSFLLKAICVCQHPSSNHSPSTISPPAEKISQTLSPLAFSNAPTSSGNSESVTSCFGFPPSTLYTHLTIPTQGQWVHFPRQIGFSHFLEILLHMCAGTFMQYSILYIIINYVYITISTTVEFYETSLYSYEPTYHTG